VNNEVEVNLATENAVQETPVESASTDTTVVEVPPAPVELRYEYQPTDEQGRPIGGLQVIKYTTPEELAAKLAEQNTLLVRKLRAETRKNRLGISDQETIEEDAPRFDESRLTFQSKALTEEEKIRISRDLLDPERFDEASDELFTAKLGVSPAELTKTISELQADRITQRAIAEAEAFARSNPDFVMCPENSEAITNWLLRYKLAPVKANFQRAFDTLKAAGILVEATLVNAPVVQVPPTPTPVVEPVILPPLEPEPIVEPAPVEAPKPVSRVPVALNRSNTEEIGAAPAATGSDIVYEVEVNGQKRRFTGLAAVDAMPADEYRRRVMSDPNFTKKVEKLEAEKAAKRQRR